MSKNIFQYIYFLIPSSVSILYFLVSLIFAKRICICSLMLEVLTFKLFSPHCIYSSLANSTFCMFCCVVCVWRGWLWSFRLPVPRGIPDNIPHIPLSTGSDPEAVPEAWTVQLFIRRGEAAGSPRSVLPSSQSSQWPHVSVPCVWIPWPAVNQKLFSALKEWLRWRAPHLLPFLLAYCLCVTT
jgi:hypothetical protein